MLFGIRRAEEPHGSAPRVGFIDSQLLKRALDLSLALAALVAFTPVLLLCGLAIRIGGARSALFRQERVGQHGRPFDILKLTTMNDDTDQSRPRLSTRTDPRMTRVGKFIRAFGFNELPQFINVLKGQMSIVGPRPEVPEYVTYWPPHVKAEVLAVRPGITGLATLRYWHEDSLLELEKDIERAYLEKILPQKLDTELWYLRNRTLWLDLRIMAATLMKSLGGSRQFRSLSDADQYPPRDVKS